MPIQTSTLPGILNYGQRLVSQDEYSNSFNIPIILLPALIDVTYYAIHGTVQCINQNTHWNQNPCIFTTTENNNQLYFFSAVGFTGNSYMIPGYSNQPFNLSTNRALQFGAYLATPTVGDGDMLVRYWYFKF